MKMAPKILLGFLFCFSLMGLKLDKKNYDPGYVFIKDEMYGNEEYITIALKREGDNSRIKAKYFAAPSDGSSVPERYKTWAAGHNVILVSSGTYMENCNAGSKPVSLTIDGGKVVNKTVSNKMDGLVVVYATGGIAVTNIKEGNLSVKWKGKDKIFNLSNGDDYTMTEFYKWADEVDATVFQTHLLVYKNQMTTYSNGSGQERERRFLAACKGMDNKLYHVIIHSPTKSTLYNGAKKVYDFLTQKRKMKEVVFMVNLDTGCQDIFKLFNENGTENNDVKGGSDVSVAANLLAYYFE